MFGYSLITFKIREVLCILRLSMIITSFFSLYLFLNYFNNSLTYSSKSLFFVPPAKKYRSISAPFELIVAQRVTFL